MSTEEHQDPVTSRQWQLDRAVLTISVQGLRGQRDDARHDYRFKGLLRCGLCDRAFEGHWVHDTPGYRCRHRHTSAKKHDQRP